MNDNILSIQNNAVATIQNCVDEPIHIPGSIQPHGFLLVLNHENRVLFCSENAAIYLGNPLPVLLSGSVTELLPAELVRRIANFAVEEPEAASLPLVIFFAAQAFECFLRSENGLLLIECILVDAPREKPYNDVYRTNQLLQLVTATASLQQICQFVAEKVQEVIGFSRVMVYRFDNEYNGEVFAEALHEGQESFLGLNYPHTDIPAQARELYLRNLMRLIPDVGYTPVAVVTSAPELARPGALDMGQLQLRSVSPIHLQYLKNMNVAATFTLSLVKEGRLWGLIACHHHLPRRLSFASQSQAFLLAQMLNAQLILQEVAENYRLSAELELPFQRLLAKLSGEGDFVEIHFERSESLRQLVKADGVALVTSERVWTNSHVPPAADVQALADWLKTKPAGWCTSRLSAEYPDGEKIAELASGVLYFPLPSAPTGTALLFFRQPKTRHITWAGKAPDMDGPSNLTPRTSFAAWQQTVEGESRPWQAPEIAAGSRFAHGLQDNLVRTHMHNEDLRMRKLTDQLLKANKELENIHWISTHDLKEPLRKIQIFASMIGKKEAGYDFTNVQASVERIRGAATRMQKLIDDLMIYGKMTAAKPSFELINLSVLVSEVRQHFADELEEGIADIQVGELPEVYGSPFQLQQMFLNLIGNAIKFRKSGQPAKVHIKNMQVKDAISIVICDNGIGIPSSVGDMVFEVFKKAHNDPSIPGSGVGLSICRKIMENHEGTIHVVSKPGSDTCFELVFPKLS